MSKVTFLKSHQLITYVCVFFVLFVVIASCFLKLDIVASAPGVIMPSNSVSISQPSEGGKVKEVLVHEGDIVEANQILFKMDSVSQSVDVSQQTAEVERLELNLDRINAELSNRPFHPMSKNERLNTAVLADYMSRKAAIQASISEASLASAKAKADIQVAESKVIKANSLLPNSEAQFNKLKMLEAKGFIASTAVLDKQSAYLDQKGLLETAKQEEASAKLAYAQSASSISRIQSDYFKQLGQEKSATEAELLKASEELKKRQHLADEMNIKAPIAGTVSGLQVRTAGQVVAAGSPLLSIVPEKEPMVAEGYITNEDAPYVAVGMPVKIKLTPYPFQKYGWIEGEVISLGATSEVPDYLKNTAGAEANKSYKVKMSLKTQKLIKDGKEYALRSGMQLAADVILGDRTVLDYIVSPIKRTLMESARTR